MARTYYPYQLGVVDDEAGVEEHLHQTDCASLEEAEAWGRANPSRYDGIDAYDDEAGEWDYDVRVAG